MSSLAFYYSLENPDIESAILCDDCGETRSDLAKEDAQPQFDSNARCDSCEVTQGELDADTVKELPELKPIKLPRARNL